MSRDLTTERLPRTQASGHLIAALGGRAARLLGAMALGALALALVYQIPVAHTVDIGSYDAAYVQGFYDPERSDAPGERPYLAGSDGSARWTPGTAYLLFPQAGVPARVTLRLRGWRASGPPPDVSVLLNGVRELGRFRASGGWEEHTFVIDDGLLKPNDIVIEIRATTAQLQPDDPRRIGVLLDRASYAAGPAPLTPYPAQLLYGALAAGMLYVLLDDRRMAKDEGRRTKVSIRPSSFVLGQRRLWVLGVLLLGIAFLALYRAQPPYPYPLRRLLPVIDGVLAALLALRYGPALARRAPALLDALALGGLGLWTAAVLLIARAHVTLSVPGVEKDFRTFAIRSSDLGGVFQADGFYNLGYPLLLWLARPLAQDNPFLAARLVTALSAALLLGAAWWLARRWLGRAAALLALLALALSPLVVAYALYLGTDMPFAALCVLGIALLLATKDERRRTDDEADSSFVLRRSSFVVFAGLAAGLAFLVRHPGVLLLPFGWLALLTLNSPQRDISLAAWDMHPRLRAARTPLLLFTLAFCVAILPQVLVNLTQTGQPFYSQQAKNIWLAVFGDGDWGRWGEASDSVTLGQVLLQDPGRFLANWWANLRGYAGAGAEDTSEFGHAIQLRLLGFPANWLAIGGLLSWALLSVRRAAPGESGREEEAPEQASAPARAWPRPSVLPILLLVWIGLYVLAISVGFALPRFFLPLAPVYAIAAAWVVAWGFAPRRAAGVSQPAFKNGARLAAGLLLLVFLWGGFATGAGTVLAGQPPDEVAAVRLVQDTLQPGERLIVRVPARVALGKYSAIAHLALPAPPTDDPAALRATGARYLLWSSEIGAAPAGSATLGSAGVYTLYRIAP